MHTFLTNSFRRTLSLRVPEAFEVTVVSAVGLPQLLEQRLMLAVVRKYLLGEALGLSSYSRHQQSQCNRMDIEVVPSI